MIPGVRAKQLEDLATVLERRVLAMVTEPWTQINVAWPHGDGSKTLDQLCAQDLAEDAKAFRRDAKKLRTLYH